MPCLLAKRRKVVTREISSEVGFLDWTGGFMQGRICEGYVSYVGGDHLAVGKLDESGCELQAVFVGFRTESVAGACDEGTTAVGFDSCLWSWQGPDEVNAGAETLRDGDHFD